MQSSNHCATTPAPTTNVLSSTTIEALASPEMMILFPQREMFQSSVRRSPEEQRQVLLGVLSEALRIVDEIEADSLYAGPSEAKSLDHLKPQ